MCSSGFSPTFVQMVKDTYLFEQRLGAAYEPYCGQFLLSQQNQLYRDDGTPHLGPLVAAFNPGHQVVAQSQQNEPYPGYLDYRPHRLVAPTAGAPEVDWLAINAEIARGAG